MLLAAYGLIFWWSNAQFGDLQVYMGASHAVLKGQMPYDQPFGTSHLDATYPPFVFLVMSPLSALPFHLVEYLWPAASAAVLVAVFSMALRDVFTTGTIARNRWRRLVVAALLAGLAISAVEPVRSNFTLGQIDVLLVGLVATDVLHRKSPARGILTGVAAAIKFTPLIFVVVFIVDNDRRAAVRAAVTFVVLTVATWTLLPADGARYFLHFPTEEKHIGPASYVGNQAWTGIIARLHITSPASTILWVALSLATLATAALLARRLLQAQHPLTSALLVVAIAGLLISPISWSHEWSWLALAPVVLFGTPGGLGLHERRTPGAALWLLLAVAISGLYWWKSHGIPLGPLAPVAGDSLATSAIALIGIWAWDGRRAGSTPAAGRKRTSLAPRGLLDEAPEPEQQGATW